MVGHRRCHDLVVRIEKGTIVAAGHPHHVPRTVARLAASRTASLLRLAAVYAFRPRWQHLTAVLLDCALTS